MAEEKKIINPQTNNSNQWNNSQWAWSKDDFNLNFQEIEKGTDNTSKANTAKVENIASKPPEKQTVEKTQDNNLNFSSDIFAKPEEKETIKEDISKAEIPKNVQSEILKPRTSDIDTTTPIKNEVSPSKLSDTKIENAPEKVNFSINEDMNKKSDVEKNMFAENTTTPQTISKPNTAKQQTQASSTPPPPANRLNNQSNPNTANVATTANVVNWINNTNNQNKTVKSPTIANKVNEVKPIQINTNNTAPKTPVVAQATPNTMNNSAQPLNKPTQTSPMPPSDQEQTAEKKSDNMDLDSMIAMFEKTETKTTVIKDEEKKVPQNTIREHSDENLSLDKLSLSSNNKTAQAASVIPATQSTKENTNTVNINNSTGEKPNKKGLISTIVLIWLIVISWIIVWFMYPEEIKSVFWWGWEIENQNNNIESNAWSDIGTWMIQIADFGSWDDESLNEDDAENLSWNNNILSGDNTTLAKLKELEQTWSESHKEWLKNLFSMVDEDFEDNIEVTWNYIYDLLLSNANKGDMSFVLDSSINSWGELQIWEYNREMFENEETLNEAMDKMLNMFGWDDWIELVNNTDSSDDNSFNNSNGYSTDENNVYFNWEIIKWADPSSFIIIDDNTAEDKNYIYKDWVIIEEKNSSWNIDPEISSWTNTWELDPFQDLENLIDTKDQFKLDTIEKLNSYIITAQYFYEIWVENTHDEMIKYSEYIKSKAQKFITEVEGSDVIEVEKVDKYIDQFDRYILKLEWFENEIKVTVSVDDFHNSADDYKTDENIYSIYDLNEDNLENDSEEATEDNITYLIIE